LTDTTTPSDRSRPPSRRNDPLRRLGRVAGVVVLVVALLLAALYLNRRAAAREVLVLSDEFAGIANEEKLQARLMLLHAAKRAVEVLGPKTN
jgi:hypothetical protein